MSFPSIGTAISGTSAHQSGSSLSGKYGKLCKWNVRTGKIVTLLDDREGSVRDPCVHYDGRQILFSYRKGGEGNYLLYVVNADGAGLRQITQGIYDDFEPCWLPDGGIAFVTTRAKRWVNCHASQVGNVWRCDADGAAMRPLSANPEQDNTPWVLPDGRILYMRWEYVDRSQVHYHHLWSMYPDGTGQTVFFGNQHPGGVFLDAKPIPSSDDILMIHSPHHGQPEHAGFLAKVTTKRGPDEQAAMVNLTKGANYRDPWPLSGEAFLAAVDKSLVAVDGKGQTAKLLTLPADFGPTQTDWSWWWSTPANAPKDSGVVWLHEPRPLVPRGVEFQLPRRSNLAETTGRFLVDNVYRGRNTEGIKPGEIKRLMVLELLPKPINFSAGMDPISAGGTFSLERVLGTVAVESDGSAYFEAPALRSLFFVTLDERGRAIKRMQSFATVQPGETLACVGCHEQRTNTPPTARSLPVLAGRRTASRIEPFEGVPDLPDFPRDIQPILDRHCVKCHNYDRRDGGIVLCGDHGPMFSHSYYTLTAVRQQVADGRNKPQSNYPPRALGSGGAPLMDKLDGRHYEARLSPREQLLVRLWLDIGAPYPGTYASLGTGMIGGHMIIQPLNGDHNWPETKAAQGVFASRCNACHNPKQHPIARTLSGGHLAYNLSHPEKSLVLLAPLAKEAGGYGSCRAKGPTAAKDAVFSSKADPGYRTLLAMVEAGKRNLDQIKRFDMPGFRPGPDYVREMKRYQLLPPDFDVEKNPIDVYQMDRKYWDSFTFHPQGTTHVK